VIYERKTFFHKKKNLKSPFILSKKNSYKHPQNLFPNFSFESELMEHKNTRPILKTEKLHPPTRSSDFNQDLKKVTWDMGPSY